MGTHVNASDSSRLSWLSVSMPSMPSSPWSMSKTSILQGPLEDCCCHAEVIEEANLKLFEILSRLVTSSRFFSLFKVNLEKDCPYWPDDGVCFTRDCAVCQCEDGEVPNSWWHQGSCGESDVQCADLEQSKEQKKKLAEHASRVTDDLDLSLDSGSLDSVSWTSDDTAWTVQDDEEGMIYVDLRKNPERFTGYKGDSAGKAWQAIYLENCFHFAKNCASGKCNDNACRAERVLFRLISGIHTSINTNVVKEFIKLPGVQSDEFRYVHPWYKFWSYPNLDMYNWRIGNFPERIQNLYFALAMMLRALGKARPILDPRVYSYLTDDEANDKITLSVLDELFSAPLIGPDCVAPFDESDVFAPNDKILASLSKDGEWESREKLREEFRASFRNISTIMDCVGCETCKLWGKLQFLGVGTGLKILFEDELDTKSLQRNEVIALLNTVAKLSHSVMWIYYIEDIKAQIRFTQTLWLFVARIGVASGVTILALSLSIVFARKRTNSAAAKLKAI